MQLFFTSLALLGALTAQGQEKRPVPPFTGTPIWQQTSFGEPFAGKGGTMYCFQQNASGGVDLKHWKPNQWTTPANLGTTRAYYDILPVQGGVVINGVDAAGTWSITTIQNGVTTVTPTSGKLTFYEEPEIHENLLLCKRKVGSNYQFGYWNVSAKTFSTLSTPLSQIAYYAVVSNNRILGYEPGGDFYRFDYTIGTGGSAVTAFTVNGQGTPPNGVQFAPTGRKWQAALFANNQGGLTEVYINGSALAFMDHPLPSTPLNNSSSVRFVGDRAVAAQISNGIAFRYPSGGSWSWTPAWNPPSSLGLINTEIKTHFWSPFVFVGFSNGQYARVGLSSTNQVVSTVF